MQRIRCATVKLTAEKCLGSDDIACPASGRLGYGEIFVQGRVSVYGTAQSLILALASLCLLSTCLRH